MSFALVEAALARVSTWSVTEGARELLFELLDGKRLDRSSQDVLTAVAETATALRRAATPTTGEPPVSLGDNYFQCPHCLEVWEGEQARECPACKKPLASHRIVLELELGGARLQLCPTEASRPDATKVAKLEWLRVESGPRWFELLDEPTRRSLIGPIPNVHPVGRRDGGRTYFVHLTKYEIHVIEGGQRRDDGKGSATELVVRELGNVLAPPAPPSAKTIAQRGHATNAELEAAIASDIENPDAYAVYADWLQGQGDPRGELIALQLASKQLEATQVLTTHAQHFYGQVAGMTELLAAYPYNPLGRTTEWKWGYLERLWISNKHTKKRREYDVVEALGGLLDHPSARFLRELTVGIVSYVDNSYDQIARVIGERSLPHLHTLILGDFYSDETELNWSDLGDVSPLYRAVPDLRRLVLRSGTMTIGAIDLPKLEELTILTGGFDASSLAQICKADWPALTKLSLQLGSEEQFSLAQLQPIFDGTAFPKVVHLGLGNSTISDGICAGLATSAIAKRLVSLDLSQGTLGDDGARALAAGHYPKLERVDVSQSWLTEEGIAILHGITSNIDARGQNDDDCVPEDRYIAGRE